MITSNAIVFLILASLIYPLGLLFGPLTVSYLVGYVALSSIYIYVVGLCAIKLNQEMLKEE